MKSEISFKVGDWCIDARDNSIKQVINPKSPVVGAYYELWQPKEGEWCWYRHMLVKVIRISIHKRDDGLISYTVSAPMYAEQYSGAISLEPFIGELPSFVKNKGNTHD